MKIAETTYYRLPTISGAEKYRAAVLCGGREIVMDRFKFEAFCEEFPFLRILSPDGRKPDWIKVKRADENLLGVVPSHYFWDGHLGETHDDTRVHFILTEGEGLFSSVLPDIEVGDNSNGCRRKEQGETILEAIDRLNISEKIKYVVVEGYYKNAWQGQDHTEEWSFTIYKPAADASFPAEIQKAKEKAMAQVKAEANF